jgi:hypothetical protein
MGEASGRDGEGASRSRETVMYFAPGKRVRMQECARKKVGCWEVLGLSALVAGVGTCVPEGNVMRRSGVALSLFWSRNFWIVGVGEGIMGKTYVLIVGKATMWSMCSITKVLRSDRGNLHLASIHTACVLCPGAASLVTCFCWMLKSDKGGQLRQPTVRLTLN